MEQPGPVSKQKRQLSWEKCFQELFALVFLGRKEMRSTTHTYTHSLSLKYTYTHSYTQLSHTYTCTLAHDHTHTNMNTTCFAFLKPQLPRPMKDSQNRRRPRVELKPLRLPPGFSFLTGLPLLVLKLGEGLEKALCSFLWTYILKSDRPQSL